MNFSLMSAQMILVISSPSSSTTGFLTLIFLRPSVEALRVCCDCIEVGFDAEAMRALSAARREVGGEAIVLDGSDVSGLVENARDRGYIDRSARGNAVMRDEFIAIAGTCRSNIKYARPRSAKSR